MKHLIACIAIICLSSAAYAQSKPAVFTLAPLTVNAHDEKAPQPELLQAILLSCFSAEPSAIVVERSELGLATSLASAANNGFVEQNRSNDAHYLKADYVLTGSASSLNGQWLVNLQLNSPISTQMIAAQNATLNTDYNTQEICKKAVHPLLKKLAKTKPTDLSDAPAEEADINAESTLLLHGIRESENGHYAQSFPYFLKVLAQNPTHADARYWLAISYAKAGMIDLARDEAQTCFVQSPTHAKRKELESLLTEKATRP